MKGGIAHIDCDGYTVVGVNIRGAMEFGIYNENSKNGNIAGNVVDITSPTSISHFPKVGRNQQCSCGSGKKYKKCHGDRVMATGIKSKNSQANFTNTKIVSDGVGIDLEDDKSTFSRTTIIAGEDVDYGALLEQFYLPNDVPLEYLKEAVEELRATKNPALIERSKLKQWLVDNGFNMAFWAQTALPIVTYAFSKMAV